MGRTNDMERVTANYNFIDLFAGAGGLSEGFLQAGFKPVAHVEMNEFAARTLEMRSAYYYLKGINNLGLYKKYLSGKISREEFMKHIPASITKTIINETMSEETLPAIFKTIGLVLKYVLESGAKRVLIALPASLRKQWELELEEKFNLESVILDRITVEKERREYGLV